MQEQFLRFTTLTINVQTQGTRYKVEGTCKVQIEVPGLTQSKTCNDQTGDQAVDSKVRENLPKEPELGNTGIVKRRVSGSQGWLDVLV